jgi:cytidine deaminase
MVQIRIADENGANRFGYEKPFGDFTDLTKELEGMDSQPERRLAIINKILAAQRPYALDHERSGVMFHGAALVRTKQDHWFLQANIHVHNRDTSRNCAEANAATEALGLEGKSMAIAELYFMGGRANYDDQKEFLGNEGQRNSPCGSCLDVIFNHRIPVGGETIVHMLPLNDGNLKLAPGNPEDPRQENEIAPDEVFTRSIGKLLPNVSALLPDSKGTLKKKMSRGYEWVHDPSAWQAIGSALQQQSLEELEILEHSSVNKQARLEAVNTVLMDTAKAYYQEARVKPHTMTIAIVRATDGKYYMGKYSRDGSTPATPAADFEALGAMINASPDKRMTDIFIVNLSQHELETISDPEGIRDDISVKMPDGAAREILKKFSARNSTAEHIKDFLSKAMESSNGNIYVFLPNDPNDKKFNANRHVIHTTVKELLPYAFQNPKGHSGAAHHKQ